MKASILFLTAIVTILFSGCAKECDEPDIQHLNSLFFELKQGGEDGFDIKELDEVYFVRYVQLSDPLIADTFYTGGTYPEGKAKFIINDVYPFVNSQSPYFVVYGYQVVVESSGFTTNIENIELLGEYNGDCGYTNTKKAFDLDGEAVDRAESTDFLLITK